MNTKILAAVSGGKDSMCMLDILTKQGYDIIVAHFNHNMRGSESDRDELFVSDFCNMHGIMCITEKTSDVLVSEEDARKARYDFLCRCAKDHECDFIATAHTKSDNAETILLNITRGTGIKGICGIPAKRDNIIRPILNMTDDDVLNYNRKNAVPFIEDSSNNSDDYSRNIIRHKVIPVLKEINPNVVESIYRLSLLAQYDEEFFDRYLDGSADGHERAILSRIIRKNCPENLSFQHVESVLNLNEGYKRVDLPGIRITKDRGKLFFGKQNIGFDVDIEEGIVNTNLIKDCLKCDSIVGKLTVSTRQPGDKIRPVGRNCTKTLKSLYQEANLTQSQREVWPVIRDDFGVVWVYNIAVAERVKSEIGDRAYIIKVSEK